MEPKFCWICEIELKPGEDQVCKKCLEETPSQILTRWIAMKDDDAVMVTSATQLVDAFPQQFALLDEDTDAKDQEDTARDTRANRNSF
jgi:hypothetical protein